MSNRHIRKMQYEFKQGARFKVDADTVGNELARIQKEHGVTTPKAVVDVARPEDAPLHPAFEWRDDVAGEKFRHWQARNLIKSVHVVTDNDGKRDSDQFMVHVPTSLDHPNGGYQPVSVVVQQPDMYASALSELSRKLSGARESLDMLKRAAEKAPDTDQDRMARIAIAVQAMQTASAAVQALH